MSTILSPQTVLETIPPGGNCQIKSFINQGSQGQVYLVVLDGKEMAMKWYHDHIVTQQLVENIMHLIGIPSPDKRFAWPIRMVKSPERGSIGYLMELLPPGMSSLFDLVNRKVEPSFWALATAGYNFSDCFSLLHSIGHCYKDISFGNGFFNATNGDVFICDNDNVTVDGDTKPSVYGTPRFIAPEVVLCKAMPSADTDLFSLATLFFQMFVIDHPLFGKKEHMIRILDDAALKMLCGTNPVFIFDPNDDSNRPVPGYHNNALAFWPIFPRFFQNLFIRSFTTGLRDPKHGRVRESEWRSGMIQLRDAIYYCRCGAENFYDKDALAVRRKPGNCWLCKQPTVLPPRLRIGSAILLLHQHARMYPHHIENKKLYDFSHPAAEVVQHPRKPNVWGLKNNSVAPWKVRLPDGTVAEVQPGRSATINNGVKINFGSLVGEIRA